MVDRYPTFYKITQLLRTAIQNLLQHPNKTKYEKVLSIYYLYLRKYKKECGLYPDWYNIVTWEIGQLHDITFGYK